MDKPLVIKDWKFGIGESPYVGFSNMVNVDVYSKPGALKISHRLEVDSDSATVVNGLIKWIVQDPEQGDVYGVDANGQLYKRDNGTDAWSIITGHGTTAANGEGLAIWKGYLFYARRTRLDLMNLATGVWTQDWAAITVGVPYDLESSFGYDLHPMLSSSQRFVLYIGNGHFMDTLEQVAGQVFDPTTPATWVYNEKDLELGSDYRVTCLEESGTNIAIGTLVGQNGIINIADVFFWDGVSDFISGGSTVHLVENGVYMMKNENNILHIIAGLGVPRIFQTVTSQSREAKRLNNIELPFNKSLKLYPGSTEVQEGEVLFGIGTSSGAGAYPLGVYSLRNDAYVLRYLVSTLGDGSVDSLTIGAIKTISSIEILVSWRDSNNTPQYGVDILTENFYTDYSAYAESPFYTVGTTDDPKTYEKVAIVLGRPLQTGDGIIIKARKNLTDDFTVVATIDTPTYVGRDNMDVKFQSLSKFTGVQFRVELTTDEDSTESPELKELIFT